MLGRISPFWRVILGLALGVFFGLFVGEPASALAIVGDAYIRLLQMTVLPYVLVSLIAGLGSLDADMAKRIGTRGGAVILALWAATLGTLVCLPLAYPNWTSAAFFSTSLVADAGAFDPLALYLPANPFYVLGHGVVPAVVLFGISLGLALIPVTNKGGLLRGLNNLSDALMKIASFVGKVAPIGIFAISASAAGTLQPEELGRLQVFLWVYLTAWAVLAFWTVPAIVAWATPFSYRDVVVHAREAMVTAFATGTVLVVLPMIAEQSKALLKEKGMDNPETQTAIDILVPTAYSFPSVGTLLGLGFVLFAAWYIGSPLSVADYPGFVSVGALVAFGSMAVAIPYMLDFFSMPADLFQLYLLGSVVTARFATGLAAMHGVAVCLLGASAVVGRLSKRRLLQMIGISIGIAALAMLGLGFVLTKAIPYAYQGEQALVSMELLWTPVEAEQVELPSPLSRKDRERARLDVVRERGTLRAGYLPDRLPFAYRSSRGDIVGYDLDLLHQIAGDLDVTLELVRVGQVEAIAALRDGNLDILAGGIDVTPQLAIEVAFSDSYIDQSAGFAVADHRRDEFVDLEQIREIVGLRIGIGKETHYRAMLEKLLPDAEFVVLDSPRVFYRDKSAGVDILATSAQAGSAWTLVYPDFSIVVPRDLRINGSTAFALPLRDDAFVRYINTWLELAEKNGLSEGLFRHWILGQDNTHSSPRWSILKDVLGWNREATKED